MPERSTRSPARRITVGRSHMNTATLRGPEPTERHENQNRAATATAFKT